MLFAYWITSSVFSLSQLLIFRIPGLKQRLGIPELRKLPQTAKRAPQQGFWQTFKTTLEAAQKNAQEEAARRIAAEQQAKAIAAGKPTTLANKPHKPSA